MTVKQFYYKIIFVFHNIYIKGVCTYERGLVPRFSKKILNFQILWGQWNKSVVNQVFNINGKGNSNLTLQQFIILMLVHRVDIKSVSQMACLLNLSKSSLSLTLSKMEKEGLLQKMPPPKGDDGRKVYLCVTQKEFLL